MRRLGRGARPRDAGRRDYTTAIFSPRDGGVPPLCAAAPPRRTGGLPTTTTADRPEPHDLTGILAARARARRALLETLRRLETASRTADGVSRDLEAEYGARLGDLRSAEDALKGFLLRDPDPDPDHGPRSGPRPPARPP